MDSKIQTRQVGNALIIPFSGNYENDMDAINESFISGLIDAGQKILVLDLENIRKIPSASISRLVKILRITEEKKARLFLLNVPDLVLKVLSMVNIVGKFTIYQSIEELESIHGGETQVKPLNIRRASTGGDHTLYLTGSLVEGHDQNQLAQAVTGCLSETASTITLDFTELTLVDSVSVAFLLTLHKECEAKGAALKIRHANEIVSHVLNTNEVGQLFGL